MTQAENLQKIVRQLSLERLSITAPVENLSIIDCPNPADLVYGSWTSIILVAGAPFKLIFKAHFTCGQVRSLLSQLNGVPFDSIQDDVAVDHMREFCNLIAGGVKLCFSNLNQACGISLPLVIAGFDETLYKAHNKGTAMQDIWCLDWGGGRVTCTSALEIFDASKLELMSLESASPSADDSDNDAFL